jgi:hypothetical protein
MTTDATTASPAPPGLSQAELDAFTSTIQTQLDAFVKASNDAVAQMAAASAAALKNMQQMAQTPPPVAPPAATSGATPAVPTPRTPTTPQPAAQQQPGFTVTTDGMNLLGILQANPLLSCLVVALVNAYKAATTATRPQ